MDKDRPPLRGYVIGLIATAVWSASAVFISYLNTRFDMPPLPLAFWRDFLVTSTLAVALGLLARPLIHMPRQHLPFFILYGFVLAVFNSLWTISVALNGAAVATVLIYVSPAVTALIGWRWLGERVTAAKLVAIALSLVGCVFASGAQDPSAWQVNSMGIIVGVGTGLAFAFYSLMGKTSSSKGINPWTATLYTFAFGSGFLLLLQRPDTLFWLSRPLAEDPSGWREAALGWGTIVLLAIGPTLGGYGLYTVSLTYLSTSTANLIVTLEPAMTAGLAFLFLGERMTAPQLLGSAVILIAVFLLRLSERRSRHAPLLTDESRPGTR
ncbi:MAG: EamA family transporter [Anaerolineae bacterium]